MQHANSTGLKWERARTWDHVLVRFSMPALEKLYNISSKVKAARLCLIFIANRCRISRSWSKIEDLPEHKKASELQSMQCRMLKLTKFLASTMNSSAKISQSETTPSHRSTSSSKSTSFPFQRSSVSGSIEWAASTAPPSRASSNPHYRFDRCSNASKREDSEERPRQSHWMLWYMYPQAVEVNSMLLLDRAVAGR